jgi:hypothetical protein
MNAVVTEQLDIQKIKQQLLTQTAVVTFTKSNGELRVMTCTLQESAIAQPTQQTQKLREPSKTNVTVWDLNLNAWRCFNINRVQSIDWESENN